MTTTDSAAQSGLAWWPLPVSLVAAVALALSWGRSVPGPVMLVLAVVLVGSVLAAVEHAHVVGQRVGSVFGTLILQLSVTVIESGLIITVMTEGSPQVESLARDSVFAAVMVCCNGILGLSLLLGTWPRRIVSFSANITGAAFATVVTVTVLTMVLPTFTTSAPGPRFTNVQLAFAAVFSALLYVLYSTLSTAWQNQFLQAETPTRTAQETAERPSGSRAAVSLVLLAIALLAVVGIAETLAPALEGAVVDAGLPVAAVGVVIAIVVLLPETLTAGREARAGRVQTSLNLALGSAMASVGLTIPVVAVASVLLDVPLVLGLGSRELSLLALTVVVGSLTIVPGRASMLRAALHLTILAAYIFLAAVP